MSARLQRVPVVLVLSVVLRCVSADGFPSFILFAGTIFALSDPGVATPTGPPVLSDCADMGISYFKNKKAIHVNWSNSTIYPEVGLVRYSNGSLVCGWKNKNVKPPNSCRFLNDTLMFSSEVGHNYTMEFVSGKTEKCVLTDNRSPQVDLHSQITSQTSSTASTHPTASSPGAPAESSPGAPAESSPGAPAESSPGAPAASSPGAPAESTPGAPTEPKWRPRVIGIAVSAVVLVLGLVTALKYFMRRRKQNRPHADPEIPQEESLQMQPSVDMERGHEASQEEPLRQNGEVSSSSERMDQNENYEVNGHIHCNGTKKSKRSTYQKVTADDAHNETSV